MKLSEKEIYQATAEVLNERKILPFSARSWSWENVRGIAYSNRNAPNGQKNKRPDVMAVIKEVTIQKLDKLRNENN